MRLPPDPMRVEEVVSILSDVMVGMRLNAAEATDVIRTMYARTVAVNTAEHTGRGDLYPEIITMSERAVRAANKYVIEETIKLSSKASLNQSKARH